MLILPQKLINQMVAHAVREAPIECCGIIAGKDGVAQKLFEAINSEQSPYRYNVDAKDLFRIFRECEDNGWEFMVIYHSHTASEAYPSPTDVRLASWPEAHYVLVSLENPSQPVVRAFRIQNATIAEEELRPA